MSPTGVQDVDPEGEIAAAARGVAMGLGALTRRAPSG
jgi:hypothetical protein